MMDGQAFRLLFSSVVLPHAWALFFDTSSSRGFFPLPCAKLTIADGLRLLSLTLDLWSLSCQTLSKYLSEEGTIILPSSPHLHTFLSPLPRCSPIFREVSCTPSFVHSSLVIDSTHHPPIEFHRPPIHHRPSTIHPLNSSRSSSIQRKIVGTGSYTHSAHSKNGCILFSLCPMRLRFLQDVTLPFSTLSFSDSYITHRP